MNEDSHIPPMTARLYFYNSNLKKIQEGQGYYQYLSALLDHDLHTFLFTLYFSIFMFHQWYMTSSLRQNNGGKYLKVDKIFS